MTADAGFYWREAGGVKVLVSRRLEEAGFVNGFSTRLGGVSKITSEAGTELNLAGFADDTAENIHENRRRFFAALPGGQRDLAAVWQEHGDKIKLIAEPSDARDLDEHADAIISTLGGIYAGVKTADCVPILLGDPVTGGFAAIHAGWRGTVRSIAAKAVEKMHREFGSSPENIVAAIGPAACVGNYEVGPEVVEQFANAFASTEMYFRPSPSGREGHAMVDLHLANADQLTAARVPAENISTAPLCTIERTDLFFSYRVEKPLYGRTGRSLSVIGRR